MTPTHSPASRTTRKQISDYKDPGVRLMKAYKDIDRKKSQRIIVKRVLLLIIAFTVSCAVTVAYGMLFS